jgi:hypothetical protein
MAEIEALYHSHGEALLRYLHRTFGTAAHADDLLQETFIHALANPDACTHAASPRAFLFASPATSASPPRAAPNSPGANNCKTSPPPTPKTTTPVLFSIHPGKQSTVSRVVTHMSEPDLGDAPSFFELSPDTTHLSVPFKDGRVSILDLATGKVDLVQPLAIGDSQSGDQLTSVPTWRPTAPGGELTFIQPQEKNGPPHRSHPLLPPRRKTHPSQHHLDRRRQTQLAQPPRDHRPHHPTLIDNAKLDTIRRGCHATPRTIFVFGR